MLPDLKAIPKPLRVPLFIIMMIVLGVGLVFTISRFSDWMDRLEYWMSGPNVP